MNKNEFEQIVEQIELAVNEVWDDVQYLNGGDAKEAIHGHFYTTLSYWYHGKRYDVHADNKTISVYKNGLSDNTRIHKQEISDDWKQELKEFLSTIK